MEYKLVYASDLKRLPRLVNKWISEGWKPTGGAAAGGRVYTQAMILDTEAISAEQAAEAEKKKKAAATKKKAAQKKALEKAEAEADKEE